MTTKRLVSIKKIFHVVSLKKKNITILLSTYNGELYLQEFLDSLSLQSCQDWFLIIRDDGSTDETVKIIKRYISERDDCYFIEDDLRLGVVQSFSKLLQYAKGRNFPYYMFADQDDVWLEYKVEETLQAMKTRECINDESLPVLVHADLIVVDKNLKTISQSFSNFQSIPNKALSFKELVFFNNVTGCTVMINSALASHVDRIPSSALMHDHWIALVAAMFGVIEYIDKQMILYRQHDSNDTGARRWGLKFILSNLVVPLVVKKKLVKKINQYNEFCKEFNYLQCDLLPFPSNSGILHRIKFLIQFKLISGNFFQKLALLLLI